jgi:hypothetical protein
MKTLFVLLAFCCFLPQENKKLSGVYRIEFEKKYQTQTYQITFKDSSYTKRWPDAVTSKGVIKYEKYKALLRKDMADDPIEIDAREIGKDTMKFSTRSKTDQSKVLNRGSLIKVK